MSRTVDEIMRDLNAPIHVHYHHGDREPHMTPLAMVDLEQLHADALVLIRRLDRTIVDQEKLAKKIYDQKVEAEKRIQQLEAELEDMTARYKIADDCAKKKGEMNEKLYAELTAVKAERDAAGEVIKKFLRRDALCGVQT